MAEKKYKYTWAEWQVIKKQRERSQRAREAYYERISKDPYYYVVRNLQNGLYRQGKAQDPNEDYSYGHEYVYFTDDISKAETWPVRHHAEMAAAGGPSEVIAVKKETLKCEYSDNV